MTLSFNQLTSLLFSKEGNKLHEFLKGGKRLEHHGMMTFTVFDLTKIWTLNYRIVYNTNNNVLIS